MATLSNTVNKNISNENNAFTNKILKASWINTSLGKMIAIGDEKALYFLGFEGRYTLANDIENLKKITNSTIVDGKTDSINSIENELNLYFSGKLKNFKTPLFLLGTPFQKRVWEELLKIPFGKTQSYREIACQIGKPTAYRAVAQANSRNRLCIIIPCHRIINSNGDLGGYNGGVTNKQWLLEKEKQSINY